MGIQCHISRVGRARVFLSKILPCERVWSSLTSTKAGEFKTKLKINHWRSSPGPPELAGFYVDSVWVSVSDNSLEGIKNRQAFAFIIK